ncbi:MAG: hypothetical protein EHM45_16575, partial [Desulfobacteraceae bacterium]
MDCSLTFLKNSVWKRNMPFKPHYLEKKPTLRARIESFFEPPQRERGAAYYASAAIRVVSSGATHIHARVRGTKIYSVKIFLQDNIFHVSCTCPHFEDHNLCKHLWAVFLQAQADGALSAVSPETLAIKLGTDSVDDTNRDDDSSYPEDEYEEYHDEYDDEDDDEEISFDDFLNRQKAFAFQRGHHERSSQGSRKSKNRAGADWRELLNQTAALQNSDRAPLKRIDTQAPLAYALMLDFSQNRNRNDLHLKIGRMTLVKKTGAPKFKLTALNWEEVQALSDPLDRRVLLSLFGSVTDQYAFYFRLPSSCTLRASSQNIALAALLETGRLYFQSVMHEQILGPFRFRSEDLWRLHLELTPGANGKTAYVLRACLKNGEQVRPLNEIKLATAGGFVFWKNLEAARLDDAGCFSLLLQFQTAPEMVIRQNQVQAFLTEYFS